MFYFARCINIIFNSLLAQLIEYDVHTTRKIKFIHAICYHILLLLCMHFGHNFVCILTQPVGHVADAGADPSDITFGQFKRSLKTFMFG